MTDDLVHDLTYLGLTESEARVYLTILQLGGGFVTPIAHQAGVERTNCYSLLKSLSKKGFVSVSERSSAKYFIPESPHRITHRIRHVQELAARTVPHLLSLVGTASGRMPKVRYYEGIEGVHQVLDLITEAETEVLSYTNIEKLRAKFGKILKDHYQQLEQYEIKVRAIAPHYNKIDTFLKSYYPKEYLETHLRLLCVNPREFQMENEVCIYDDKVSVLSLAEDEHLAVVFESGVYADTSRTIFNLAWLGASHFEVQ